MDASLGSAEAPLPLAALARKFHLNAARALPSTDADAVAGHTAALAALPSAGGFPRHRRNTE